MKKVSVIKENKETSFLKVYPKVSDDIIWLEASELLEIIVYNSAGKVLINKKSKSSKTKINITSFDQGLYWIKAKGANATFTDKFIKL